MSKHFEELWEMCEKLHQDTISNETASIIIDELAMKINLYKIINSKSELTDDERKIAKSRTIGEILMTLTKLSLKDDINVFAALNAAKQSR